MPEPGAMRQAGCKLRFLFNSFFLFLFRYFISGSLMDRLERPMKFRSPYNYDTDVSSSKSGVSIDEDTDMSIQSYAAECDINTLVKAFTNGRPIPGSDLPAMQFEIDRVIDYQTALNELRQADESFMLLPSDVREFFQNDPAQLLDFVHTPENRDKAVELGLIPKPPSEQPVLVRLSEALADVKSASSTPAAPPSDS